MAKRTTGGASARIGTRAPRVEHGEPARARATGWAWTWLLPLACAASAAWRQRGTYYFYDDWSMIDHVLHSTPFDGMMMPFNGHLWMLQYWVYRIQVFWFGVNDHLFLTVVFLAALIALHVSLAALFRASGLTRATSALLGGLLTYLPAATESSLWIVLLSPALAVAAGVAATAIALGRPPTPTRVAAVALLSLLSVGLDSALALPMLAMVATVTTLCWRGPRRLSVLPAFVALGLWLLLAEHGPSFPADLYTRARFVVKLLVYGAGGLVGRGKTFGAVVLAALAVLLTMGYRRGLPDARGRIMLLSAGAALLLVVSALAWARAGIEGLNLQAGNRYLQNVAIPLTLAIAPLLAATIRSLVRDAGWPETRVSYVGRALIVAALLFGLPKQQAYTRTFMEYNEATRDGVAVAALVIRRGCPSGVAPDEKSTPLGLLGPQLPTRLVRELLERGLLTPRLPARIDPQVIARMCPEPAMLRT